MTVYKVKANDYRADNRDKLSVVKVPPGYDAVEIVDRGGGACPLPVKNEYGVHFCFTSPQYWDHMVAECKDPKEFKAVGLKVEDYKF